MSTATESPAVNTAAPKKQAAKATKKGVAPAKKTAVKKTATPKPPKEVVQGTERENDLPWCDKKVALFKTLRALKAIGAENAQGGSVIAEKGAISGRDVRHYSYHAKSAGLIGLAKVEGLHGYGFYLTAKGAKLDPVAEFKAQEKAKAEKNGA